jgi:hypothetical protein
MSGEIDVPPVVSEVLSSAGRPLDAGTRAFMEPRFGHDFSRVRVHAGARAAESARAVGAAAYTVGERVVFGAGRYAPETEAGGRLLAHELAHVVQQGGAQVSLQRACDPTKPPLSTRARPVFFPNTRTFRKILRREMNLSESSSTKPDEAVGLVQQALVDLGFDLGTNGPNKDGVDQIFGEPTTKAVATFQTDEAVPGAKPGEVDGPTLRCLDEQRAHVAVPPHLKSVTPDPRAGVTPADVQIKDQQIGGADEEIFFDLNSSTLSVGGKARITRLLTRETRPLKGCPVTLQGYVSEDELVERGPALADERIQAVSDELVAQGHDQPGPICTKPPRTLRTPSPLPERSARGSDYRVWRKVQVVTARGAAPAARCALFHTPSRAESRAVKEAVKLSVGWMDDAIGRLKPGDARGDAALTAYFGGTSRLDPIKSKLVTWRDHLKNVVSVKNQFASDCNDACRSAVAFNEGQGADAEMTVCPSFFGPLAEHSTLSAEQNRAFILMHEAGHGSIGTRDTAYGHLGNLIEFLAAKPEIAEANTDSYTLMVLCLKEFKGFCAPTRPAGATAGMNKDEQAQARRGLGWLQTWMMWAAGATSNLYADLNDARKSGDSLVATNFVSAATFQRLGRAFNLRRPERDTPPTFGEQTFVAAVLDRLLHMWYAASAWPEFEKDTGATPKNRWSHGPGRKVFLTDDYFKLTTDRERVELLLRLILRADAYVSITLEKNYETYIKEIGTSNEKEIIDSVKGVTP